ncbi:hypothetical protein [Dictyobacter formicarum]|uniref:Uncharacterized protein n=1 Tax=Dictyobacter formicarum TaxID=2778368 RepID=A0ABQ3VL87_9CHLR|nr:hypothetical protein [Dictyobacter formicarum]GHO86662.1 hypothetical protein KSZ_46680 [Dictyobacter formicarum]
MVRQCAWCLRLINSAGERLSPLPLPKLYEASHGICGICGMQWMEQVIEAEGPLGALQRHEVEVTSGGYPDVEKHESITQMVLQLQEPAPELNGSQRPRRSVKIHMR